MKDTYAKMTFRLVFISFLALMLIGCGESGTSGGDSGPGVTASINLTAGDDNLPADGVTSTTITAVLVDSVNAPVFERTSVVFRTTHGTFRNGLTEYRVKTSDASGIVTVTLISDDAPGTAEVSIESNNISQKIEVKFFDPTKVGTITLRTGSASITADGASQVSIIATVEDNLGNLEEGATVTFKTSLGAFEGANDLPGVVNRKKSVTDVDGEASVMLVSGTTIGTATILASLNGLNTSTTVIFTADEPHSITLRAAPSTIRPNGTTTLFAGLKDINGNPVAGQTINFSQIVNESEGTLSILSDDTNVNGEAQATYIAGKDPGTDILQAALASNLTMKFQTPIIVDPGAIVIDSIAVTAGSPSLVADGLSKVKIRAIVTDIDENPAVGKTVTFTTTAGTFVNNLSSITATTDEFGRAEVMLKSTTIAGPVIVRAECDGFINEAPVEFVPGPADHIIMYALPDTVPPNGPFTTAVIIQDQYDNRIDDQRLMLQVRRVDDISKIVDTAEMTPDQAEDGVFRFDWTAATAYGPGNLEITARVNNGVSKTVTVIVDETATIVGAISVIAGAEEIKADGTSSVLIRATVLDYNGDPAQGITVDFATTLGTLSSVQKETNANGIADVMLKSGTIWGTATVTADANGFWDEVPVRFTSLKAGGVSIIAMPGKVNPGGQSTIIAELRDASGSPVPDEVLYFDICENNTLSQISAACDVGCPLSTSVTATTDINGRAIINYYAGIYLNDLCGICACSGDRVCVTLASDSSVTDKTCISVYAPTNMVGYITLESDSPTLPANKDASTAVTATVYDTAGVPMPEGTPITFSTTLGTFPGGSDPDGVGPINSQVSFSTIDDSGTVITSLIAGTIGGMATITAVSGSVSQVLNIIIDDGKILVGSIDLTSGSPSLPADGFSSTTITAVVKDIAGNPVPMGTPIAIEITPINLGMFSNGKQSIDLYTIDASGTVTTSLIAGVLGGAAKIVATAGNISQLLYIVINDGSVQVGSITLTANPAFLPADGKSSSTLTATVKDPAGNPVPVGTEVVFTTLLGTFADGTKSITLYTSNTSGTVSTSLISVPAPGGIAFVTATCYNMSQSIEVPMRDTPVGSIQLTTSLNTLPADGTSRTNLRALVLDANGNPEFGVPVTFTTTAGTILTTTSVITDANGIADNILIAASTSGVATVTARTDTAFSDTLQVTFGSGASETVTVTPVPQNLTANGVSTSTVTIEVRDIDNNPVNGTTVVLSVDYGTLNNLSVTTSNGTANVTYTSPSSPPTGGIATITATTTSGASGTGTISLTGTLVASINLAAFPTTIPANGTSQSTITAELTAVGGGLVPDGTEVTFAFGTSGSGGSISPLVATTASGIATTFLTSGTTPETVTIQATAGGRIAEIDVEFTAGSVLLTIIPNSLLGTGVEESEVTATVFDVNDVPQAGVPVTITLSDQTLGSIVIDPPTLTNPIDTDALGEAFFTFIGAAKGGSVDVTATTDTGLTATGTIDIQPPPAFIEVADGFPDPTVINIAGTGGQSTSQIVFDVKDIFGEPVVDGYRVDLIILDGPNGGEAIEPTTAYTTDGQISTILRSGSRSGPVSIRATYFYNSSVYTVTSQITITSGTPVGEEFGIFAEYLNISGLWRSNLEDGITVNVGDITGNPVPDGTAISFKTYNTGGTLSPGSATTGPPLASGLASNTLRSVGSYTPPEGFLVVTGETNNGGRTTHVRTIAVTPGNTNIMYAGTDGGGVYKSTDAGVSWANVSASSDSGKQAQNYIDPYVNSLCVDPDDVNTVYAATGYLGRGNIFRSIDGGITWLNGNFEDWFGLISTNNAILTITCDDNGSPYVWAGTNGLGAIFSSDGENFQWGGLVTNPTCQDSGAGDCGVNGAMLTGDLTGVTQEDPNLSATSRTEDWTAVYTQVGATVTDLEFNCNIANCPAQGAANISPLTASATAGYETWRVRYLGGWESLVGPSGLSIIAVSKFTINETWTVTCTDPTAGAEEFSVLGNISGYNATYDNPPDNYTSDANEVTFFIDTPTYSFATGDQWTFNTLVDEWIVRRDDGVNPPENQILRAKTGDSYTSDDGEVTFTINAPLQSGRFYRNLDQFFFDTNPIGEWVVTGSLSGTQVNLAQTDVPYVSDNQQVSFIIVEGTDPYELGDTWAFDVTESGLGYGKIARDIVREFNTHGDGAVLYAATASGVYRSINGGLTWAVTDRFTGDNITCLAHHPDIAGVVYAGTENAGVWYTINDGTLWQQVQNPGMGGGLTASIPLADLTNTGNGVMSNVTVTTDAVTENWTVECTAAAADAGLFTIIGSVSGSQGTYDVDGGVFSFGTIPLDFTISDGSVDFIVGDTFTFRTTRDPGNRIIDLVIDSANDYVYAATYFDPTAEPFHAVGNLYSLEIRNGDGAPRNPANPAYDWVEVNGGLPAYDPPDDVTLFPQHVMAFDSPTSPSAMYTGGEGINFSRATGDLSAGNPSLWINSKTGLTNLIMARMPILFTGECTMNIASIDNDAGLYTYTVYVEDDNGNPPIVGSSFKAELLDAENKVLTVLRSVEYPDTYTYQGTWTDPANPDTNNPYIIRVAPLSGQKVRFTFTPLCQDTAPGCSGSSQEVTYSY